MELFIAYLIGFAVGCIAARPMKSWQEGYDAAKDFYGDWDKGFNAGWDGAFKTLSLTTRKQYNEEKEKECDVESRN